MVRRHLAGTRYGIRIDPADGLLTQGADGHALTWMDAVVDGAPVTPRRGKAVELNALWINGLAALAGAARAGCGRDAGDLDTLRATGHASRSAPRFPPRAAGSSTWSTVPAGDDPALRPNQLLAYGLPYAPLRGTPTRPAGRRRSAGPC